MSKSLNYSRPQTQELVHRLMEPRRFIQVVAGARQVGKTTLVGQAAQQAGLPTRYASADQPTLRGIEWLEQQWEAARSLADEAGPDGALLVLDEAQKVSEWSEAVKRLWDADTRIGRRLKVVVLGSAPLLVERGLSESLAGRFEMLRLPHWSLAEMRAAFGWTLNQSPLLWRLSRRGAAHPATEPLGTLRTRRPYRTHYLPRHPAPVARRQAGLTAPGA